MEENMTPEEQVFFDIKKHISRLPEKDIKEIDLVVKLLETIHKCYGANGTLAIAYLGAKLAAA